ncbi:putative ARP2/3 complex subunit [Podospora fimiseda]|uniref:Actin-related protein 2/3 complex subunit 5 n=1 Tax=Podospora fimiseda TaxID=252190 RepID=A0AAN7BKJ9_9PEZI|nr:putative ARP2/3 complex subunit [Podospora fimiseda]
MSIIQQITADDLTDNWRRINIDALDPDSSLNFPTSSLHPPQPEISESDCRNLSSAVRQLLRGGDAEGALRTCLENPVYNGPDGVKEQHLGTVVEVLQSIKASEMSPLLKRVYEGEGGVELLDCLMKYLYKGMGSPGAGSGGVKVMTPQTTGFSQIGGGRNISSGDSTGSAMSVLLSWHEKVVEVAGLGCIGRVMTDFRRV